MKFNSSYNNFSSGEWSPKMLARTDVEQYSRSCSKMQNFITQMQGGAFRRSGSKYIGIDPFATEIGNEFINALNNAIQVKLIPYFRSSNSRWYSLVFCKADDFSINTFLIDTDDVSDIQNTFGISYTPEAEVGGIPDSYEQVGDYLFLASLDSAPRLLYYDVGFRMRMVADVITNNPWETVPFGRIETNGSGGTMTVTGTLTVGGTVTVVSSAGLFRALNASFSPYIKVSTTTTTGVIRVDAYSSSTTITGTVLKLVPGASGVVFGADYTTSFEISDWWDLFPMTVCAYQGRIIFGGTYYKPDTLWASRIGDVFEMMEVPCVDDTYFLEFAEDNSRPFTLTPNTAQTQSIHALTAGKTLVILTNRAEIVAYGTQGALGPLDFNFESSTSFGSERVQPVRVNNYVTYVQRGGRKVRDIIFSFNEDQYKSTDLSFVADHLTGNSFYALPAPDDDLNFGYDSIFAMAATEGTSSLLYAHTAAGKLICCTLDRDYQVNAWSTVELGGVDPKVIGLMSVPTSEITGSPSKIIIAVQRTINAERVTFLEEIRHFNELDNFLADQGVYFASFLTRYMDSWQGVSVDPDATTVTGFDRLAGETVQVMHDGMYLGEKVVSLTGEIELPRASTEYSNVFVGFKFTSILQPSPIEIAGPTGTSAMQVKKVSFISLKLWKSFGGKYGLVDESYPMQSLVLATPPSPTQRPDMFTGSKRLLLNAAYDREFNIQIIQDEPFPLNVLALVCSGATYD